MGIQRYFVLITCLIAFGVAEAKESEPCEAALSPSAADERLVEIKKIWALIEDFWAAKMGRKLPASVLVLYREATDSACGRILAQIGPLYCHRDGKTYVDLDEWDRLSFRSKAPGLGAFAYTLAHEYAHHLQKIWGVLDPILSMQFHLKDERPFLSSQWSVFNELWADALAGHFIRYLWQSGRMDAEEVAQAQNAAARMGDDWQWLVRNGKPMPPGHDLSHGRGQERQEWFLRGFEAETWAQMNPFLDERNLLTFPPPIRSDFRKPFEKLLQRPPY